MGNAIMRQSKRVEWVRGPVTKEKNIKVLLPSELLQWTTVAKSTVNTLTLHRAEGDDGKAMVGRAARRGLNENSQEAAVECHLQRRTAVRAGKTSLPRGPPGTLIMSPATVHHHSAHTQATHCQCTD